MCAVLSNTIELYLLLNAKLNINGVHDALLKLEKGITSEMAMLALNEKYKKVGSDDE